VLDTVILKRFEEPDEVREMMKRRFEIVHLRRRALLAAAALVAAACSHSASGASVSTPGEFLDWLAHNPSRFGVAAYEVGSPANGVYHNADRRFPLASTRKVLILGAYAKAVQDGKLHPSERVAISAVERWYWPGTDGGAHQEALQDLQARGRIDAGVTSLDDVA